MKYITDCPGQICKLNKSEIRRVNPTKGIPTYRKCCYHGGKVIAVEKECKLCGDIFQTSITSKLYICQKCKDSIYAEKKDRAEKRKTRREEIAAEKKAKKLAQAKIKQIFKKVKKKVPAVRAKTKYEKFCMGPRRGYCKKALTCTELDCGKCEDFVPCFGYYDPNKLPVIGKNLR